MITYDRNGIKIGDYVNYSPDEKEQGYLLLTKYSGYEDEQLINQDKNMKWQVLRIYEDNSIDLIGTAENSASTIGLCGALGYNNGVYLLDDICKNLYSKGDIIARSIDLADMEYWMSQSINGINARNSYIFTDTNTKYSESKQYIGNATYRPDIYEEAEDENDPYYITPTEETYKPKNANPDDTLTTQQTYYEIEINSENYNDAAKVLFSNEWYWVASRCIRCDSTRAYFGLRYANSGIHGNGLFFSDTGEGRTKGRVRPIVHIEPYIEITPCIGDNNIDNMHKINL